MPPAPSEAVWVSEDCDKEGLDVGEEGGEAGAADKAGEEGEGEPGGGGAGEEGDESKLRVTDFAPEESISTGGS